MIAVKCEIFYVKFNCILQCVLRYFIMLLYSNKDMLVISRSHNTLIRQLTAQIEHSDPIIMLNVH